MANKVKYGLKNVHYAKLTDTDGTITYATPVPIPGAVNLSLSPVGEVTEFFADDIQYYVAVANGGYDGTLEAAMLPESFATDILSETVSTTDKVATENANAVVSEFALLFEFAGDVKEIKHALYRCKATRPNIESGTKSKSVEVKTEIINITVSPLADGKIKAKTTDATTPAVFNGWYTKVWEKDGSIV